jgi:hypothetical protein
MRDLDTDDAGIRASRNSGFFNGLLDLVRALAMLTQVKANALRAKFLLDTADMVTGPRFRDVVTKLIELMRAFVPEERHAEVARELALLGARVPPATES